ncbi:hypothetical protein EDD17DRAFT_1511008 [Pisolithus thermaeus]|nr:hypothetical protein EDD17DRAFT_1511008 [Pisolithus thermaeus]
MGCPPSEGGQCHSQDKGHFPGNHSQDVGHPPNEASCPYTQDMGHPPRHESSPHPIPLSRGCANPQVKMYLLGVPLSGLWLTELCVVRTTLGFLSQPTTGYGYCILMTDYDRTVTAAEQKFFNECDMGHAIEELLDEGLEMEEAKRGAIARASQLLEKWQVHIKHILDQCKFPLKFYLPLTKMHEEGTNCGALIQCTASALNKESLERLLISTQQSTGCLLTGLTSTVLFCDMTATGCVLTGLTSTVLVCGMTKIGCLLTGPTSTVLVFGMTVSGCLANWSHPYCACLWHDRNPTSTVLVCGMTVSRCLLTGLTSTVLVCGMTGIFFGPSSA